MVDPIFAVALKTTKEGVEVLDKLGALERVLLKLKSNPDRAAARLSQALGELSLGYTKLHAEMLELGSMSFEPDELREARKRLKQFQRGKLRTELAAVKGHCTRIDNIYSRYLTGWFDHVLTKSEATQIARLFDDLANMDGKFLKSADALSDVASQHASAVLLLLEAGDIEKASQFTRQLDKKLSLLTEKLSDYMRRLWELQAEFIAISRAL